MSRFSSPTSRCSLIGYAAAFLWGALATAPGADAQSRLFLEASGDVRRPSDVYVIQSDMDPSVCEPVLASLNKEYRVSDDKLDENPRVSLESDSLLQSSLQVPWTRKLVQQPDAQFYKTSSLDVARVNSRGRTINLFRRGLEKFSIETGALTINRLWMSTGAPPSFPSELLTAKGVARIKGAEILVDISDVPRIDGRTNLAARRAGQAAPTLLNVVVVNGNLYLLAVDAIQSEISAPKGLSGTIDLYVLRIFSERDIRAVCRFRST
jgi:hypothetical protein